MTISLEAKGNEMRALKVVETLEKMSRRTDSRLDVQKILDRLSPSAQIYVKHLVMSGPSSLKEAAKATGLELVQVQEALEELEEAILNLKKG